MPAQDSRSSLASHTYPPFYACYLLKSLSSPRSRTTYIGSTPNPPRRLRQHNGELTQGAWKTRRYRPWAMCMIVYGFPSKLHALQFEWAWQHPELSRHLRAEDGGQVFKGGRNHYFLVEKVRVVRAMLAHAPYNTWPLHVKLFHEDAVKAWRTAEQLLGPTAPLPLACRVEVELEGVDGKAGGGTGREVPIEVTDATFSAAHLRKFSRLLASPSSYTCSICALPLPASLPPLATSLCPLGACIAVSHLACLAKEFLEMEGTGGMIPRCGKCRACGHRLLWGDVVRGCYRRLKGGVVMAEDDDDDEMEEEEEEDLEAGLNEDIDPLTAPSSPPAPSPRRPQPPTKPPSTARPRPRPQTAKPSSRRPAAPNADTSAEFFDLSNISGPFSDEDDPAPTTSRPPPKPAPVPPRAISFPVSKPLPTQTKPKSKPKPKPKPKATPVPASSSRVRAKPVHAPKRKPPRGADSSGEFFDLEAISGPDD